MVQRTPCHELSRRGLLGVAGLLVGGVAIARAEPSLAPPSPMALLAYHRRLRARLADAGGGAFDLDFAQALLPQANDLRAAAGLQSYDWDEGLAACARAHLADLAARNYFAHEAPEGFSHVERVALLNRDFCGSSAENLASRAHYRGGSTPSDFQALWEQSPPHRQNLLHPNFGRAGYGVVRRGDTYLAAGVYAQAGVQLAQPLPLVLGAGPQVTAALDGASPSIERFALTAPFRAPTLADLADSSTALRPGAWQLRPLRPAGGARYDVLSGPLFFVG